jgi:UDP-N-acetylmuramate: L-alanyl-gamma-D-glutamyl-meso-diaminopimelate ligase
MSPLAGAHNAATAIAARAMAAEGAGVAVHALSAALAGFSGVRRRQELRGVADGVRVYDDFAHHPTAVAATVSALRARHPTGRLWAMFEPRSATSSRKLHEPEYAAAFTGADVVLLAPVGRSEVPEHERLDVQAVARAIAARGARAEAPGSIDAIVERVVAGAAPGDTLLAMSNGAFGRIHDRLLAALAGRAARARLRRPLG